MWRRAIWVLLFSALPLRASDALQWSGFGLLRGSTKNEAVPLKSDALTAQLQLGIDWRPSMSFGSHVHLLARNDDDRAKRGRVGVVEAYLDQNVVRGEHRLRLMEGAFFLPTSRENVDALWESPYTITPSALNSWLGEEFRPIGIDAAYTLRRTWTAGLTAFRGNDTFGAFPAVRGWALRDYWAVLGEHMPVKDDFTSVSAETDHRIGWAARGRWNNDHATLQATWIDNRADAQQHGELLNWATRFYIVGGDYRMGDWTAAAESGWGRTSVIFGGVRYPTDIRASYVLLSRRLAGGRASLRADAFQSDVTHRHAITAAYFFAPRGPLRIGVEGIVSGGQNRVSLELRYNFAGR